MNIIDTILSETPEQREARNRRMDAKSLQKRRKSKRSSVIHIPKALSEIDLIDQERARRVIGLCKPRNGWRW